MHDDLVALRDRIADMLPTIESVTWPRGDGGDPDYEYADVDAIADAVLAIPEIAAGLAALRIAREHGHVEITTTIGLPRGSEFSGIHIGDGASVQSFGDSPASAISDLVARIEEGTDG